MTYEIVYGEHSLERLFAIARELNAPELVEAVEAAMARLAADPVHLGSRGSILYQLPNSKVVRPQQFDFHSDVSPGRGVHFRAYFYFGEDEVSVRVVAINAEPYSRL